MTRLKAFLNALSDSYPSEVAICSTESSVCCKRSQANSIRHWVRQAAGAMPTVWLKCCANAERDIPTCVASVSTVQPCPGASCMQAIAALSFLSRRAKSQPVRGVALSSACNRRTCMTSIKARCCPVEGRALPEPSVQVPNTSPFYLRLLCLT
ncbi:hypothetical protein NB694_002738 [Pantoea ananatis]|nr:hypothetical protein [Pantoea ananatis]